MCFFFSNKVRGILINTTPFKYNSRQYFNKMKVNKKSTCMYKIFNFFILIQFKYNTKSLGKKNFLRMKKKMSFLIHCNFIHKSNQLNFNMYHWFLFNASFLSSLFTLILFLPFLLFLLPTCLMINPLSFKKKNKIRLDDFSFCHTPVLHFLKAE